MRLSQENGAPMELKEFDQDKSHRIEVDRKREGVKSGVGGSLDATAEQTHRTGEERRRATALRIESVAGAAHHAAGDLEDQFPQTARYLHDTAAGLETL